MINPDTVFWDDWLLLSLQVATLVALIIYVWKTWQIATGTLEMAKEAKEASAASLAPRVIIYFDPKELYFAHFVIENVGSGTAKDTQFTFAPPLKSAEQFGGIRFFETPKVLPPGYGLVHLFDSWKAYFEGGLPTRYQVTITYTGVENQQSYSYVHELDIESIRHREALVQHGMHDLVEQVKKLDRTLADRLGRVNRTLENLDGLVQLAAPPSTSLVEAIAGLRAAWTILDRVGESEGVLLPWDAAVGGMRMAAAKVLQASNVHPVSVTQQAAIEQVLVALF